VRSNDFTNLFITKDIDVSSIPKDKLPLVHVQLHTFFAEGNGKGLKPKDIVDIHNKIKNRLNSHQDFDKLDKQV
jgi:hypothetical protein